MPTTPSGTELPPFDTELLTATYSCFKEIKKLDSAKKQLALKVKLLYFLFMNQELKKKIVHKLLQVARKFAEAETFPITINQDIQISTREAHAIESIGDQRCVNVTEIANYFCFTKSAASQLVSKLTRQEFIVKKQSSHSNKELQLSLTGLGWQAYEAHAKMHGLDMQALLDSMNATNLEQLVELKELLDTMDNIIDQRFE